MLTFARLVVDADGLSLVLAVLCLHADEVGVCRFVEARPHGQDMVVGLVQHLHHLRIDETGWKGGMGKGLRQAMLALNHLLSNCFHTHIIIYF